MTDDGPSWRENARRAPWARLVLQAVLGGVAYVVAGRAFGSAPSDAAWGGASAVVALLAVQTWLVLRHGPDAAGGDPPQDEAREDEWKPPLFGNQ